MIKIGAIIVLAGAIGGYFIKQKTAKPVEEGTGYASECTRFQCRQRLHLHCRTMQLWTKNDEQ